ncbi:MAG: XdhC family protein, partial [Pyrinomonadaceae bacterium]|nr:XdhC family protein [Pyrinomonadaceae bacterium]
MNELRDIVEAYGQAAREGKRTVLATVVRTSGSVYRRAGARMLVTLDSG